MSKPKQRETSPPPPSAKRPTRHIAPLDAIDRRIVEELLHDGRISVSELAERVHVSRANAYTRLARLERDKVITGYGARVDPRALGLDLVALITLTVDQMSWRSLPGRLEQLPGLVYQAVATGLFDHVLLVRVADLETLRDVVLDQLHSLPEIRSSQTIFLLHEEGELATRVPRARN